MKKRGMACCALLCLLLTGCGRWGIIGNELDGWLAGQGGAPAQSASSAAGQVYYADLGDAVDTCFFTYTVESAALRDSWRGCTAAEGNQLLDAVVTIDNTSGGALEMYVYDFQIQWGDGDEDFGYEAEALRTQEDALPERFTMAEGESRTVHIVGEVPAGRTMFSICHQDRFADGTTGDSYFVFFTPDEYGQSMASAPAEGESV